MQPPTRRYIGADIRDSSIHLVEASFYKGQYQFLYHSLSPFENIPLLPFNTKKVVLSIPDAQVLMKKICIGTKLSYKERREYLAFEMEKLALCSREELYFDFKVLKKMDNNQEEVLCATVRREAIDSYIKLFENTPLKVKKIIMDSDIEKVHVGNLPEKYHRACEIAITGFKKESFNFLAGNTKKYGFYNMLKLGGLLTFILFGTLLLLYFNEKPKVATNKPFKSIPKKSVQHPAIHYGQSLKDAPINQIKMLGRLEDKGEVIWGIIQTPDGKIVHILKGDIIGFEQGCVSEILSNQIILIKNDRRYQIE
jgi:hypothetical protein